MTWVDRFWAKVERGPRSSCWRWTACTNGKAGYGTLNIGGRMTLAHRASFFLANGKWPKPFCLHKCDNPICVNPAHLFEGTNADNGADMSAKFRHAMCKLTEPQVRAIVRLRGRLTQQELADRYGVTQAMVSHVQNGRNHRATTGLRKRH